MRSEWLPADKLKVVFTALTEKNRLACLVSLATGLRIGDVLALRTEQFKKQRFTIKEEKTGKSRAVRIPNELYEMCLKQAGRFYVFEGRTDAKKHHTRQAVFKDLRRAAKAFRVAEHVSPHTARKTFAVGYYLKCGKNLKKVQALLNHSSEAVTMIYALADKI